MDADGSVYGLQIWLRTYVSRYFESTMLQELEWHFHAALFALVLGYGMIYNTHVRVDLDPRQRELPQEDLDRVPRPDVLHDPLLPLVIYFAFELA